MSDPDIIDRIDRLMGRMESSGNDLLSPLLTACKAEIEKLRGERDHLRMSREFASALAETPRRYHPRPRG